jgi:hypothetical protein
LLLLVIVYGYLAGVMVHGEDDGESEEEAADEAVG